jgi:predicted lysophospholipase L1 biosynthesis ABC-type transport system permease subunit
MLLRESAPRSGLMFAAVGGVLLIACVNLANLQLARAVSAERETAVRAALGASKGQLVMSRLTESMLLAMAGGAAGVALAFTGVRLLLALVPSNVPRLNEVQVSAAGAACLQRFCQLRQPWHSGILPALRSLRVHPQSALQANSSRTVNSREGFRTRSILVAGTGCLHRRSADCHVAGAAQFFAPVASGSRV